MSYNKEYNSDEIIKRICESAQKYKRNLLNKNIMFLTENKKIKKIEFIQTVFLKSNFLHLTGIKYYKSSNKFFEDCLGFSNLNLNSNNKRLKYYYPKTLIQDNLKNNIIEDNKIVAIFSKNKNQKLYNEITYFTKNINLQELFENKTLRDIIDFKNIYSENLSYNQKIIDFLKCLE